MSLHFKNDYCTNEICITNWFVNLITVITITMTKELSLKQGISLLCCSMKKR